MALRTSSRQQKAPKELPDRTAKLVRLELNATTGVAWLPECIRLAPYGREQPISNAPYRPKRTIVELLSRRPLRLGGGYKSTNDSAPDYYKFAKG